MSTGGATVATPRPTRAGYVAIAAATSATGVLLVANRSLPVGAAVSAVAIALGAWLLVYRHERAGSPVDVRVLALAIGALIVLAVALEPIGSHDLWSYTMYGRMVARYGVSPYSHVPRDFPHDPFLHLVSAGWRHTPSVYGPLFVAFATLGSALAGGSTLVARLFYEIAAAVAVAVALRLVWRRTGSPAAVMLLGLNPLVVLSVINGGHNDAVVGLAVLGTVLLAEQERPVAAGFVLAFAALIKVTALLALPALVAWILYRYGRRAAEQLAGVTLAWVALGYAIAGPAAISALGANHRLMSRASLWQGARALIRLGASTSLIGSSRPTLLAALGPASIAVVCGLAVAVAWSHRRDPELGAAVALALTTYLVAGVYVLPWYGMWMLPVACLVRRTATLLYTAMLVAFVTVVYVVRDRVLPGAVETGWWWIGAYIGPLVLLVAFVVVAFPRRTRTRPTATRTRALSA